MASRAPGVARRLGLVLTGFVTGVLGAALGAWFYVGAARIDEVRTEVGVDLRLARESIDRIDATVDERLIFALSRVVLRGDAGDTVLAARTLDMTLDARSFEGDGPIDFVDVRLSSPVGHLVQAPDGEWNYEQAFGLNDPARLEAEPGRPLLFHDVRIVDGRLTLSMPALPEAEEGAAFVPNLPVAIIAGAPYNVYEVGAIQGSLPTVRIGGVNGWRAEFAGLNGNIRQPAMRIVSLDGWAEQSGLDAVRFDVPSLVIGDSRLATSGLVTFVQDGFLYDLGVRAEPLLLDDFRPLFPNLPAAGLARFDVDIESITPDRLALRFAALDVDALDSRIVGQLAIGVGGDVPLALMGANLSLAPLRLSALEELGLTEQLPIVGDLTGEISTTGMPEGLALVDLTATIHPRERQEDLPSVLRAEGTVALGEPADPLVLDGVTLGFRPLRLETFAGLGADQEDPLRGTVEGSIWLAGTMDQVRLEDGSLTLQVGDAAPTRVTSLEGHLSLQPALDYDLRMVAQPLSLATITEIFPAAPFRSATVSGPITIAGSREAAALSADLSGPAGGIDFVASVAFTDPLGFDIRGSVDAFAAGMLLRPDVPVEGPLTGTFAARGSSQNLEFDVDLAQLDGRFVLEGTIVPAAEPPRVDVVGNVIDFRVGALVGEPRLFPEPVTGPISITGGGGQPYLFDLGLRGEGSEMVLTGSYLPGAIPVYDASGSVMGLDLGRLPTGGRLPSSVLAATIDIDGRGTDLETLEGSFAFDATPSIIGGRPLDAGIARLDVRGGVMYVDTLDIEYDQTRFAATGTWGLLHPSPDPLRYSLTSPDLAGLRRLLTPADAVPLRIGGSIETSGTIAGSIEYPIIDGSFEGRNLRYEDLRASTLAVDMDVVRTPGAGWSGELDVEGRDLSFPGGEELETLRLRAVGNEGSVAFEGEARRDARTQLAAVGVVELMGLSPQTLSLTDMILRLEGASWELLNPTLIRFTADDGAWIDNLVVERLGAPPGLISIDGRVPPTGAADLVVALRDVDLSDLNRISPALPAIQGIMNMDVVLEGPVGDPEMTLTGRIEQLGYEGATAELMAFDGTYSAERLIGEARATADGESLFNADFSIPLRLSFEQMLPVFERRMESPVEVMLTADSVPLDLVAALLPAVRDGRGVARAAIEVGGTLDAPVLAGWARVDRGSVYVEPLSVRYTAIETDLVLSQDRLTVNAFSATSDGTLVASGAVDFPAGVSPRLSLSAGLDNFRVMDDPEVARVGVSGQVRIDGSLDEPLLTGSVSIRESTFRVPELAQAEPGLELGYLDTSVGPILEDEFAIGPAFLGGLRVDAFELGIDESVWLESSEMRVQISGDLILYRTGPDLRVFGALQALRGTYALEISAITREFDVVRGRVQFFGTGDLNPSLDILAAYRVRGATVGRGGDVTILVQLGGTLLSPRVQLTADTPVPLSETDLISYLLFGQPSFELGGVTARFAEQILVQEVLGGIIASELERPILRAGLCDWVRVRPGTSTSFRGLFGGGALSSAAIECGWEIGPDLFLTAQTGVGILGGEFTDGRLGLEWQIDNQWLWEASYGSVQRNPLSRIFDTGVRTQFSTDIRRQWEYGRPTQRGAIDLTPEDPTEDTLPPLPGAPALMEP